METRAPLLQESTLSRWSLIVRAIFISRQQRVLIFKFTPDGNQKARSPLGLAPLQIWPLTERAISLWRNKTATRSSNLAPMQPRALSPPSSSLLTWPLTVWAICLCGMRESQSIVKFTPDGTKSTFARSGSPDQKWEYVGARRPKDRKAGTNEVALDLSDPGPRRVGLGAGFKAVCMLLGRRGTLAHALLSINCAAIEWKALKEPSPGTTLGRADKAIATQVKKRGLPKKTDLRLIWGTVEVRQWVDSNTAILYSALDKAVRENSETRPSMLISLVHIKVR